MLIERFDYRAEDQPFDTFIEISPDETTGIELAGIWERNGIDKLADVQTWFLPPALAV